MIEEVDVGFEEDHGPSLDEVDDEMRGLLEQLDRDDNHVTDKMEGVIVTGKTYADQSPPLHLDDNHDVDIKRLPSAEELKPADVRNADLMVAAAAEEVVPTVAAPPIVDMRQQFEQLEAVTNEILQGTRSDRQETQDAITLLRGEIDKAITGGQNPPRMYVDNLVKALEVKAQINMTAVKAMEAKAKMLAATKAGTVIQNQINNANANVQLGSDKALTDLLSEPLGSEDEY